MEILDQENKPEGINNQRAKTLNLIAIISILIGIVIASIQIVYGIDTDFKPLLPSYANLYINHNKINLCLVTLTGIFPTLYFRLRKRYLLSTCVILSFSMVGLLFMNSLKLYTLFYYFI